MKSQPAGSLGPTPPRGADPVATKGVHTVRDIHVHAGQGMACQT